MSIIDKFERLSVKDEDGLRPGGCKDMCPVDEVNLRIKNKLVHVLEKRLNSSGKYEYTLVKEYSRPAAGKVVKNSELRTLDTLVRTTDYLINKIYTREDVHLVVKYEFLFDRFRAIRQDLIIQRIRNEQVAMILERIMNFYILADYKLCWCKDYDEFINNQHLVEVLQTLLGLSGYYDDKKKSLFFSIYLLLNLNNYQSVNNLLKSAKGLRKLYPLNKAMLVSRASVNKNYISLFVHYKQLPLICQLAFHRKLPQIEVEMLKIMNCAYSFKNSRYPVNHLTEMCSLNGRMSLQKYIDLKLVDVVDQSESDESFVEFKKANSQIKIDSSTKLSRETVWFLDNRLAELNEADFLQDTSLF